MTSPALTRLYNIEAETAILGGILLDPNGVSRVAYMLKPEHFQAGTHQIAFREMLAIHNAGDVVDLPTFVTRLNDRNLMEKIGGTARIASWVDQTVSAVNIDKYAEFVVEKWRWRELYGTVANATKSFGSLNLELTAEQYEQTVGNLKNTLLKLSGLGESGGLQSVSDLSVEWFGWLEEIIADPTLKSRQYLPTGFHDYDKAHGGLPDGMTIVAGRPAMGKTSYALNICLSVAQRGKSVLIFSLEMTAAQLMTRLVSSLAKVDSRRLESGKLEDDLGEMGTVVNAIAALSEMDIDIDQDCRTLDQIIAVIENWRLKNGRSPDLVMIDFLGLIGVPGMQKDYERTSHVTTEISTYFTKTLQSPCLMLAQLSRAVEQRTNKRPQLSDLADSGKIEQNAPRVDFVYRDKYYNPDTPDGDVVEIITGKDRFAPCGTTKLLFQGETTTFLNLVQPAHARQSEYAF